MSNQTLAFCFIMMSTATELPAMSIYRSLTLEPSHGRLLRHPTVDTVERWLFTLISVDLVHAFYLSWNFSSRQVNKTVSRLIRLPPLPRSY